MPSSPYLTKFLDPPLQVYTATVQYRYIHDQGHEIIINFTYIGTSSTQQRQDSRNTTQVNISLEKMIRAGVLGIQLLPRNSLKG